MRTLISSLTMLLAACASTAHGQTDGRSLYMSKCATCHGRDGSGQTTVGRSLNVTDIRPAIKTMTDDQLGQLIVEGRGQMPANKKFDDQKVGSLTLFLRDLVAGNPNTGRAVAQAQAQTLADVATVYQKKCSTCHGHDGSGRTTAGKSVGVPDLTAPAMQGKSTAEWAQAITDGKGKMPAYAKTFTSAQVNQLVSYIHSLPAGSSADATNARVPASKNPPASAAPATTASHAASAATSPPPASSSAHTATTTHKSAALAASGAASAPSQASSSMAAAVAPSVPKAPLQKPPATGRQLYGAKCSTCHARDGSGTGTVGLSMHVPSLLSPEVQARSDEDLALIITHGGGDMPAYKKKYSAEQIQLLVGYIRELANKQRK